MKTAVSLPDDLFKEAERVAISCGLSRSQLYAKALREYLERIRDERTTQLLNAVYPISSNDNEEFLARAAAIVLEHS